MVFLPREVQTGAFPIFCVLLLNLFIPRKSSSPILQIITLSIQNCCLTTSKLAYSAEENKMLQALFLLQKLIILFIMAQGLQILHFISKRPGEYFVGLGELGAIMSGIIRWKWNWILNIIIGGMDSLEEEKIDSSFHEDEELNSEPEELEGDSSSEADQIVEKKPTRKRKAKDIGADLDDSGQSDIFDNNLIVDKLPQDRNKLRDLLGEVQRKIKFYKSQFLKEEQKHKFMKSQVGDNSVPICADVTKFDFDLLAQKQLEIGNREFDVIMMDPPWKLSTSQPSRGVAIQYCSLSDQAIGMIPIPKLQTAGFLLIWVINAKFQWTVNVMSKVWGYKIVDTITWVKRTAKANIAKGHGYYLQHAKETCIVGMRGDLKNYVPNQFSNVIFSDRRGQSQKPLEIYQIAQALVPNGFYLQIFGRRNNLRNNWVTIGNQL